MFVYYVSCIDEHNPCLSNIDFNIIKIRKKVSDSSEKCQENN